MEKPAVLHIELAGDYALLIKADIILESGWPELSPAAEFEVVEERSGRTLRARVGEPLMISLERAGLVVPAICRS